MKAVILVIMMFVTITASMVVFMKSEIVNVDDNELCKKLRGVGAGLVVLLIAEIAMVLKLYYT
jgi:hypothetical protein